MEISLTMAGFLVGILVGLTGVGGGALMTPWLILGMGIPPVIAVGTDLIFAALTKMAGAASHFKLNTVNWRILVLMSVGSVPAALVCSHILVDGWLEADALNEFLRVAIGVMLLISAALLLLRKKLNEFLSQRRNSRSLQATTKNFSTIVVGVLLGCVVSLTSVGAGALGVAAIALLYPHLKTAGIVGTDIFHAIPLTLIAGLAYWSAGNVNFGLLPSMLLGSIPGIVIGSHLTVRVSDRWLKAVLGSLLAVCGLKLFV